MRGGGPGAVDKAACSKSRIGRKTDTCRKSEIVGSSLALTFRFKQTNISFSLTRKDSVLWGVSITER